MKFKNILFLLSLSSMLFSCGGTTSMQTTTETTTGHSTTSDTTSETSQSSQTSIAYDRGVYSNVIYPLKAGKNYKAEIADPHVIDGENGFFYIYATGGVALRSEDMCSWEVFSNQILQRPSWNDANSGGICGLWAPDIAHIGDLWIYYYSLSVWGGESATAVGYATSDSPEGPFVDQGKLFNSTDVNVVNVIDPAPFIDDDGSVYLSFGSFRGIGLIRLNDDGCGLYNDNMSEAVKNMKIIVGVNGDSITEASYILKKDDYYYYFGSSGTCCEGVNSTYAVITGRSKSIFGPYLDRKGRTLSTRSAGIGEFCVWGGSTHDGNIVGPGHNSLYIDKAGDTWLIYHGYAIDDNYATRHLLMDKLLWDADGYPYVSGEKNKRPSYQEDIEGPAIGVIE